jgi:hypothetical protein
MHFGGSPVYKKYSVPGLIGLLLAVGFIGTSLSSYLVSKSQVRQTLVEQGLPQTGDTVYSEIQKEILRPTFIAIYDGSRYFFA